MFYMTTGEKWSTICSIHTHYKLVAANKTHTISNDEHRATTLTDCKAKHTYEEANDKKKKNMLYDDNNTKEWKENE